MWCLCKIVLHYILSWCQFVPNWNRKLIVFALIYLVKTSNSPMMLPWHFVWNMRVISGGSWSWSGWKYPRRLPLPQCCPSPHTPASDKDQSSRQPQPRWIHGEQRLHNRHHFISVLSDCQGRNMLLTKSNNVQKCCLEKLRIKLNMRIGQRICLMYSNAEWILKAKWMFPLQGTWCIQIMGGLINLHTKHPLLILWLNLTLLEPKLCIHAHCTGRHIRYNKFERVNLSGN